MNWQNGDLCIVVKKACLAGREACLVWGGGMGSGDERGAFDYGFVVEGDEVVVTLGEGLAQAALHGFGREEVAGFEHGAEEYHVVGLGIAEFDCRCHGVDGYYFYVGARGQAVYARGVVDERAAGFYFWLEFVEALLVEHYCCVEFVENGRRYGAVGEYHGDVGCAAALLGAVGGHPCHFETVHQAGICEYLAHRENALSAESGYNYFFFHGVGLKCF